jgi:DNA-binding beta-propeller fold protein YncE
VNAARHARSFWARLRRQRRNVSAASALAVATGLLLLVAAALTATSAQAFQQHSFLKSFGSGHLSNPIGIAVDNSPTPSQGDVYIANQGSTVQKYDSSGNLITSYGDTTPSPDGQLHGTALPGGAFSNPFNVAVDPSNGDLYVADRGANTIDKFDSSGNLITSYGDTTPSPDGRLHGTAAGGFDPWGLTVDPSTHDLYVGDIAGDKVDVFNSSGAFQASLSFPVDGTPVGIALDSLGHVYVSNVFVVHVYDASTGNLDTSYGSGSGVLVDASANPPLNGLAVDPTTNHVYAGQAGFISEWDSAGNPVSSFGADASPALGHELFALSVDATTQRIYVADYEHSLADVFTPLLTLPNVTTNDATNIGHTTATVNGNVDPDAAHGGGPVTDCHFDYGTDTTYSLGSVPCLNPANAPVGTNANPITAPTDVHGDLSGLTSETTYHFRLVATNADGTSNGAGRAFQTLGANVSHALTAYFGAAGSTPPNPYPLSGPTDVDVDQASGDFYVTDPGNNRVEKFDSAGNFILMFGKGVDQTHPGDVCTAASGDTCQAGTSSSSPGGLQTPTYLAVDNSGGPSNGDVYVAANAVVSKFDATGHIVSSWGKGGQKDGSDTEFGFFAYTTNPSFAPAIFGIAVGPNGELLVAAVQTGAEQYQPCCQDVFRYTPAGLYQGPAKPICGTPLLELDPAGDFFSTGTGRCSYPGTIVENNPPSVNPKGFYYTVTTDFPTTGFAFDPSNKELYQAVGTRSQGDDPMYHGPRIDHYSSDCHPDAVFPFSGCDPVDSFGAGQLSGANGQPSGAKGVAVDGTSHTVYVAESIGNDVAVFGDARPIVTVPPPNPTETSVTLNAHIDPAGRGDITSCYFEYGFDKSYGTKLPCTPDPASSNFTAPTDVTATITGLSPGTSDHYRVVVSNSAPATTVTPDQTFITTQPPGIDGLASANLTATTADLNAQLNPNGLDTTYRFEYGPTTSYGQSIPVPDGSLSASNADQAIGVHLTNLIPHVVYHYTLVAINSDGTTTAPDHTFNFYPPSCPNENVRQQTQANYLPDCRAYELTSPGDAAGTLLYPGGPNTGYATNPPRFSFTGLFSTIPGAGGDPANTVGDLYVATRTDTGWVTRYVSLPATQTGSSGGPPTGLPGLPLTSIGSGGGLAQSKSMILTDPSMSKFVVWNEGNLLGFSSQGDTLNAFASNAPYLLSANGSLLDRWPTNLAAVPPGVYPPGANQSTMTAPGGVHALDCPPGAPNYCPGDVNASSDLSHFVFAAEWNVFAPGGQLSAPGSVYDNDTAAGTVAVVSKTPAGDDIPAEPTDHADNPLRIPAVSSNGSHILISSPCAVSLNELPPCLSTPSLLYMRVNDALTYDVSQGHYVTYVGMTGDGSKVYFTTDQQLTPDDTDTSTDLYIWSEATDSITLVSKGTGGAGNSGNSDACSASFTTGCGVVTYSNNSFCILSGGVGGNCRSDNFIASQSGDVYFFSPEQLDGSRGIPNQENLYLFHDGEVRYVATFTTGSYKAAQGTGGFCLDRSYGFTNAACSDTPVARMQVSPDGSHMAFLTASPVTQYDNAGHLEMYLYDPSTRTVVCASCLPSGAPPSSDVLASQNGLFMANDGRAFFSTDDALVKGDTNDGLDVYEYVNGRPQLITPGTGETQAPAGPLLALVSRPGLNGVSADGRDVYFATFNTLVPQDHNGLFLKYYDARAGGGFPAPAPPPPCNAADECHGAGSSPPGAISNGTGVALGAGGNAAVVKKHGRQKKRHHRRKAHQQKGGSR